MSKSIHFILADKTNTNKYLSTILIVLFIGIAAFLYASDCIAAEMTAPVFDVDSGTVSINGKFGDDAFDAVSVIMTKKNVELSDISSLILESENDYAAPFYTGADGNLSLNIKIPSRIAGGKYYIYLIGKEDSGKYEFLYANVNDSSIVDAINSIADVSSLEQYLAENCDRLCVEKDVFKQVQTAASQYLFKIKQKLNFKDTKEVIKAFNVCIAQSFIDRGADVKNTIIANRSYIGIDWEADYANLDEDIMTRFCELLKKVNLTDGDAALICKQQRILADIQTASVWQELKNTVLDFFDDINPNTKVYDKLSRKDSVYEKLFAKLSSVEKFSDIADRFESCSDLCYDNEHKSDNKHSGGSGGSSGGGGGGKVASLTITPASEADNSSEAISLPVDVSSHWAKEYINTLVSKKIINGFEDGTFRPDENISRAQFIKMLCLALGITADSHSQSFNDVTYDMWCYPCIAAAFNKKIAQGDNFGNFNPDSNITREDMAVLVVRALKSVGISIDNTDSAYTDNADISQYAVQSVASASSLGIINGMGDGSFKPKSNATRAEAAAIISRIINKVNSR